MRRVLLDTSGLYAFVSADDAHHAAARQFVARLAHENGRLVVLDLLFAEAMTLLKARLPLETVLTIGTQLRSSPFYEWVALGERGERATWDIFAKYKDKQWSYMDCALLAVGRQMQVKEVFSFDQHLLQMPHLRRVPK